MQTPKPPELKEEELIAPFTASAFPKTSAEIFFRPGAVAIRFPQPTESVGFTPKQAIDFARELIVAAKNANKRDPTNAKPSPSFNHRRRRTRK